MSDEGKDGKVSRDVFAELDKFREASPNMLFILKRSKNGNLVCYEGMLDEDGKSLAVKQPVDVYWMDVDPAYVKKARAKGRESDRVDLNYMEKTMAYGLSAKAIDGEAGAYTIKLVAFGDRAIKVYLKEGKIIAEMTVSGQQCNLQCIDITSVERTLRPAKVVHVDLYGENLETGELITERITP
jgi:hypothetical protein